MSAALELVGKGRHFASLGIREVTRQAGVVPTSFYRHFRSMDDLGLQLVDELGLVLRRMMREARGNVLQADKLIEESVGIFVAHAQANRSFFMFMAQGLAGESRDADLDMTCDLVVRTVAFSLTDLLSIAADDDYQVGQVRKRTSRFLQMIFVGAGHWQSESGTAL